jgi:hybrid cluster-associated redox disulfide protein
MEGKRKAAKSAKGGKAARPAKRKPSGRASPAPRPGITRQTSLAEAVMKYPETADIFRRHGLHCIGCAVAAYETIEQGCRAHGIDPDAFVKELNAAIGKPSAKPLRL